MHARQLAGEPQTSRICSVIGLPTLMITLITVAVHIAEGMLPVAGGEWVQTGGHTRLDYINQLPVIMSIT